MDTNVQTVNQDMLVDLFPGLDNSDTDNRLSFGMQQTSSDIFDTAPTGTQGQTDLPPNTEATNSGDSGTSGQAAEGDQGEATGEADILGDKTPPPAKELADLSSYYQDRIKNGTFIAIEEEDAEGNKVPFIPKTAEEYDEVLQLQISYKLDAAKQDMEKKWYEGKSPAWKAISQYAEYVEDPSQLIPFLQGVQNLQSVSNINEQEIDGAEQIVRVRLEQRGEPKELIEQQIEALKTTDKLISTATQYKPLILQQEQSYLANQMQQQQQQDLQYKQVISELRTAALAEIEQPIFGKTKLKQDEKAIIYDLIGEPLEDTKGYGIYNAIDSLFEVKDFKTLKEIALLLGKKDSFYGYLGTNVANQTAASLEKKLRVAGDTRKSSGNDYHEDNRGPSIQRNQFNSKPTFGR